MAGVTPLIKHGITPSTYSWPHFPQSVADAGATEFRGFTTAKRFSTDDVQVDHAGDIGATFYRMYLFYGDATVMDTCGDLLWTKMVVFIFIVRPYFLKVILICM